MWQEGNANLAPVSFTNSSAKFQPAEQNGVQLYRRLLYFTKVTFQGTTFKNFMFYL